MICLVVWVVPAGASERAIGQIVRSVDDVTIRRAGQDIAATDGETLRVHDHIRTGEAGRAEMALEDGSTLKLGGNAHLALDVWAYRPDLATGHGGIRQYSGPVLVSGGRLSAMPGASFMLRTPVATIAIRGTEVWAGPLDERYAILLIAGRVSVENTASNLVLDQAGTGVYLPLPPAMPEPDAAPDPAGAWTMPGSPPVKGGAATPPGPWPETEVARALRMVGVGR